LVALAAVSLSCKGGEPARTESPAAAPRDAQPHPAAPAAVPSPVAPAEVTDPVASPGELKAATTWIDALRGRSAEALAKLVIVPFDYRDTRRDARKRKCASRVSSNAAATMAIAACLATDEQLHANLLAMPELRLFAIAKDALPPWAAPWAKAIRPGLQPMSTFVHGDGSADEIVLLVGEDGVHGLWQNVTFEPK
jgi:hypothetical protein